MRRPLPSLTPRPVPGLDLLSQALSRASRAHRRGEPRQEILALRQACMLQEYDAALWTRLGAALVRTSRQDDALQALRHALWLREKGHDARRARVTRKLIDCATCRRALRVAA